MNVNLSPLFKDYIKQQLESGMCNIASENKREALRLMMQQDEVYQAKLKVLRNAIADGLNSGESIPLDMSDIINVARINAKIDA